MKVFTNILIITMLLFISFSPVEAQEKKVRISPKAEVGQTIGLTDVKISYSRPRVKGRQIWGSLVPYGKVWRAGADEATKFTFSTDVIIEGKKLKKGSYSFFVIPQKDKFTLVFNKVADQWGAFEYNDNEDALRIIVNTQKLNHSVEWLTYSFTYQKPNSALVNLEWEKLRASFKIETKIN